MIIDFICDLFLYIWVVDEEGLIIIYVVEIYIYVDFVLGIRDVVIKLNVSIYVLGESDDMLGYKNMFN